MYERLKLLHRTRSPGEKVEGYLNVLESLTEACEFRDSKEEKIKEQLLLQGEVNPSVKSAVERCSASEMKHLIRVYAESDFFIGREQTCSCHDTLENH